MDGPADLDTVGGKAFSLMRLRAAGMPVPTGFVVTTAAYRAVVAARGLEDLLRDGSPEAIIAAFGAGEVPEEIAGPVRAAYRALGEPAVAVRSSATAEDLPELSFAGQQDSFLDVRGEHAVLDAVRRCWASLWTERAVAYRRRHGVDASGIALAVVVQELVDADAAGVLFTADPVTGAPDRMVVDATWGLGETLVGGRVTSESCSSTPPRARCGSAGPGTRPSRPCGRRPAPPSDRCPTSAGARPSSTTARPPSWPGWGAGSLRSTGARWTSSGRGRAAGSRLCRRGR
jgi:phosphoenolpyruvate synthase/pyruvate phosphate dikinase